MLRVVFMGTPEFSVPTLAAILDAGHELAAVYSQPARAAGRGLDPRRSPVQAFAEARGLPVLTPKSLRTAPEQAAFAAHRADVAVVVAYGLILPQPILDAPRSGCLNLHASALPRWRGAAPIQRAIMAGDAETAAMVMRMDAGLDTGPVCLAERCTIGPNDTAGQLHDRLAPLGAALMVRALTCLAAGELTSKPQPGAGVTYASKIDKAESRLDFARPARAVHNHIRGLSPFPGAWFEAPLDGRAERVRVLRTSVEAGSGAPGAVLDGQGLIACAEGAVRLVEVQRAGKRALPASEFLRGFPLNPGLHLGRA